ncbi:MAG: pyridoxamine 5'-phosphate oxidase family protein [Chloroflexi bacterium]|nr:pyridoxamine 5'-phosphate oxidase family protein [Chloroflexota bacterium]
MRPHSSEPNHRRAESAASDEPAASRPDIPKGYGISESVEGMLPWRWAEERLERAQNYWVVTARPNGRPHAVPVWGAWVEGCFYFDGGGRKASNMAANPAMVVHLESGAEVVIVEGVYDQGAKPGPDLFVRIQDAYAGKYDYRPDIPGQMYTVRPRTVLAWHNLPKDATRWRFRGERQGRGRPSA